MALRRTALTSTSPNIVKRIQDLPEALRPTSTIPSDAATTNDGPSCFSWAPIGLDRIIDHDLLPANEVASAINHATWTLSSCFSGVGCFDIGALMCSRALNCWMQSHDDDFEPGEQRINIISKYFIEKDIACRAELLHAPYAQSACIFDDVTSLITPDLLAHITTMAQHGDNARITEVLLANKDKYRKKMYCYTHDRRCPLHRCRLHSGGSPCVDHTSFGNRSRDSGPMHILYAIWVVHRLLQLEDVVVHENVAGWTFSKIDADLGSAYVPMHVVLHGTDFGLSTRRDRLWSVFVRKDLIQFGARGQHIFTSSFLYEFVRKAFFRFVGHTVYQFLFECDAGVEVELAWARNRPGALARRTESQVHTLRGVCASVSKHTLQTLLLPLLRCVAGLRLCLEFVSTTHRRHVRSCCSFCVGLLDSEFV
jgi:hypothetical protein